jgi:leishmanolysin-like peptidase
VTSHCNNKDDLIAYTSVCQQEQALDRPVAGFVNFCVEKLSRNFYYSHLLTVMKHEIFHTLGFSSSLYGYYRADDGTPLTARVTKNGKPAVKWSNKVIN